MIETQQSAVLYYSSSSSSSSSSSNINTHRQKHILETPRHHRRSELNVECQFVEEFFLLTLLFRLLFARLILAPLLIDFTCTVISTVVTRMKKLREKIVAKRVVHKTNQIL